MTIYQRSNGGHVAESLRPIEGSSEAVELEKLAADPESGWRAVAEKSPAPVGPPAKTAVKAEWVAYAVAQGAEQAEAEAATKDDLITTYGGDGGGSDE
ncbi:hypothetical protein OG357_22950 [Streptomyces sp. NBC_01255]|uniref:hypothetical protein n=1 Tax=Streptomyces sp. NBC_01255 TaxID=2903798 RepID=UPI002E2EFB43|nr:hypothetical protein [Streptomyces sp. NBC_01255]